jgi:hypothetical protein
MNPPNPLPFAPFTPSELVLLRAPEFIPAGGVLDKTKLFDSEVAVSTKGLARTAIAVALFANEQAGAIGLFARQKNALLGLTKRTLPYADPANTTVQWPSPCLETSVKALAETWFANKGQNDVATLVYRLQPKDVPNPWAALIEMLMHSLAARGLLQTEQKKQLGIFKSTHYILPPSTADLAARLPGSPIQQWLADSARTRPELHKLLLDQIEQGLKQRVEQTPSDTDN